MPRRNKRNSDFDFSGDYKRLTQLQKELVRNHATKRRKDLMTLAIEWDDENQRASEAMRGHEA